ncbi:cobalt-precorrin-5B (C(1))-methyltransferase CbiD [Pannus brasiliensis CCIBt3594]|uniref:Cobalt-precorrin-5B C(1)-methyltransferase n=1 Tax=Pannus brasiliensis CCIBt3594 TaxID=1427578 RepID=A0AAW9QMJ2_9CHRO
MTLSQPREGYVLPVFACASAIAALRYLHGETVRETVSLDLLEPRRQVDIEIEQLARISADSALAITRSDPGDNLDLTRNTPIWALVETKAGNGEIVIKGGEGIGIQVNHDGKPAIYAYADRLLRENLRSLLQPNESVTVTIILPEGRKLAERTSNAAFGVVEGLSLLGSSGISQPLSAPGQLEIFREELARISGRFESVVFCIGENGLDLARKIGIPGDRTVKTANWIGPLLVEAALQGVSELLLFGYHGKLLKLAGGIFHTHHHLADGRMEILTAHAAKVGLATEHLQTILAGETVEKSWQYLQSLDRETGDNRGERVLESIAETIDRRCQEYIFQHAGREITVGSILFDRSRTNLFGSENGIKISRKLQETSR